MWASESQLLQVRLAFLSVLPISQQKFQRFALSKLFLEARIARRKIWTFRDIPECWDLYFNSICNYINCSWAFFHSLFLFLFGILFLDSFFKTPSLLKGKPYSYAICSTNLCPTYPILLMDYPTEIYAQGNMLPTTPTAESNRPAVSANFVQ